MSDSPEAGADGGDGTRPERLRKGRTLEERRADRRNALLDSAFDLFATKGYRATTIEEICRAAYVSTRNFYEEFVNREDLLAALYDRIVQQMISAVVSVDDVVGPTDTGESEIEIMVRGTRARVEAFVRVCTDDPRIARVALVEMVGVGPAMEAKRRAAHKLFADYIATIAQRFVFAGSLPDADFGIISIGMVGAINEILVDWSLRDDKPTIDELVDNMHRIFLGFTTFDPTHPYIAHHPSWAVRQTAEVGHAIVEARDAAGDDGNAAPD